MKYEWTFGAATFKRRLIVLLEERGLSQKTVAEMAGVSQSAVSKWLSGTKPDLACVETLAQKAGVPVAWLAHGEGFLNVAYNGIDGFIYRAKNKTLPRLIDVNEKLEALQEEDWFMSEEREMLSDLHLKLQRRRARLARCVEALENLPESDEAVVLGILTMVAPEQLPTVRGEVCLALGLPGTSTDDEILEACRTALKKHPLPGVGVKKNVRGKGHSR